MMKGNDLTSINSRSTTHMRGFTLVELLVAMVIATIVLAAIYGSYLVQQNHYLAQSQVTEMQQNIRAAMDLISRDIRMAGYDSTGKAGAKFVKIEKDLIYFTADLDENKSLSQKGEHIAYDLYTANGVSTLGRAINDPAGTTDKTSITVTASGGHFEADAAAPAGHQPVAQVIEALQFVYYDNNGDVTSNPDKVRSVEVSMLARAAQSDPQFTNSATYPIGGTWPKNDNYRRRYQQMTIQCRNMGL